MKKREIADETAEIGVYVKQLSIRDRQKLLKGLRKKILLDEAQQLSNAANKSIQISMDDILKEIAIVRRKHAA